jgi:replicative DNA helicase
MNRPLRKSDKNSPPVDISTIASRIPPHSVEAEESVLGAILIDNQVINDALTIVQPEDFYRIAHQQIFSAMESLDREGKPIDIITLGERLKARGHLDQIGGVEFLGKLSVSVPSAANTSYYAKLVKEKSLRRGIIRAGGHIISSAFDDESSIEEFLNGCEQKVLSVSESRAKDSFHKVGVVVQDSIKLVEKLYDSKELITGIPTGFMKLDEKTSGLQPSDLVIIAARPSMGKTAFALSIVQHVGLHKKGAVALFSLEMSKEQLVLRMLCSEARVPNQKVKTGHLGERDFPRLVDAASKIAEAPIFIDDTPSLPISELRAKCRRLHRDTPLSLVVVDYLQLMRSPSYANSREQEIADISRSLKALAKELHVPVVALSQLNRSLESRNDKRPMMSDLRESGAIEQDADIIMFIYRDEFYNADSPDKGVAEIIIGKHRSGPTGLSRLAFSGELTRFDNLEERDDFVANVTTDSQGNPKGIAPSTLPASDDFGFDDF